MRLSVVLFALISGSTFGQFPSGHFYSIFPDRAAIITIDSSSISLEGGNPVFDQVRKRITLDSAQPGQKVHIVNKLLTSDGNWRLIGKVVEQERTVFAILDLVTVDKETFDLNFNKDEYRSAEAAEGHLKDTSVSFGFRFISENRVSHLMSLRPLKDITPKEMVTVYRATNDSVSALMKRLEGQPDAAMFAMMTKPMQFTVDEFVARGYNPLLSKEEIDVIMAKLKEDPEVKKALEETPSEKSEH